MAEDDPGLRSVLERGLREHGYVVDAVADGTAALSYLRSYTYEVAVLDWRMPDTTGIDVVRAMRARGDRTPVLTCGDLTYDPTTRVASGAGGPLSLTAIETALLELLLRRSPAPVNRRTIAVQVWDDEADPVGSNTIDVHVGRLRGKLAPTTARIETVRGFGYRVVPA